MTTWHANTPLREEDCTDVSIRESENGDLIATVAKGKANARLIAAAPELLEALENLLARTDENPPQKAKKGDLDATFRVATFYRDREAARSAIAKAKAA